MSKENITTAIAIPATVVHCKRQPYDVYIGRPSKWGNPFVLGMNEKREDAIRKYRDYIMGKPHLLAAARRELRGKVLGCWCAPRACHGDVLVEIANATGDGGPK